MSMVASAAVRASLIPFSSPFPSDLYVKLYVVNVATQKRIIKKKTRVCRHDREPSFNETFRFQLNPTGHSIQVRLAARKRSHWELLINANLS